MCVCSTRRLQILDAFCSSFHGNALGKGMITSVLRPPLQPKLENNWTRWVLYLGQQIEKKEKLGIPNPRSVI